MKTQKKTSKKKNNTVKFLVSVKKKKTVIRDSVLDRILRKKNVKKKETIKFIFLDIYFDDCIIFMTRSVIYLISFILKIFRCKCATTTNCFISNGI